MTLALHTATVRQLPVAEALVWRLHTPEPVIPPGSPAEPPPPPGPDVTPPPVEEPPAIDDPAPVREPNSPPPAVASRGSVRGTRRGKGQHH